MFIWILEANYRLVAALRTGPAAVATAAVVARLLLARLLLGAHRVEIFLAAIAAVCGPCAEHFGDDGPVPVEALRLIERPLVVLEPQPFHAFEDHLDGLGRGALEVRVFDAQDEFAGHATRVQPAEQGGPHAADVQQAGGTGREARDYLWHWNRWTAPVLGARIVAFDSSPADL
jgi:hypothetical protein